MPSERFPQLTIVAVRLPYEFEEPFDVVSCEVQSLQLLKDANGTVLHLGGCELAIRSVFQWLYDAVVEGNVLRLQILGSNLFEWMHRMKEAVGKIRDRWKWMVAINP